MRVTRIAAGTVKCSVRDKQMSNVRSKSQSQSNIKWDVDEIDARAKIRKEEETTSTPFPRAVNTWVA